MFDLELAEAAVSDVAIALGTASTTMSTHETSVPRDGFESLTGISGDVESFLLGLAIASASLADAAESGHRAAAALMSDSSAVDRKIAASLSPGYAVNEVQR